MQLLIRTKGMPPQATPAGALLLRYADRLLTLGSDAVAAAKDLQDITMGTMTVAASQTTGVYLMPTLIGQRGHLNAACLVLAAAPVQADGCLGVSASTRCLIRCTSLMALSCDEAVRADTRCSCPCKQLCTSCWACYLQKSICPWNTAASNGLWACLARSGCSLPSAAQHCCLAGPSCLAPAAQRVAKPGACSALLGHIADANIVDVQCHITYVDLPLLQKGTSARTSRWPCNSRWTTPHAAARP